MKKLFFLLLFVSVASFAQIKINPIYVGYPDKEVTQLMVRVMPFETDAKTCGLYYELKDVNGAMLANGNLTVDEIEFEAWGKDMLFIESLALNKLHLTRKDEL